MSARDCQLGSAATRVSPSGRAERSAGSLLLTLDKGIDTKAVSVSSVTERATPRVGAGLRAECEPRELVAPSPASPMSGLPGVPLPPAGARLPEPVPIASAEPMDEEQRQAALEEKGTWLWVPPCPEEAESLMTRALSAPLQPANGSS